MTWRRPIPRREEKDSGIIRNSAPVPTQGDARADAAWAHLWFAVQRRPWSVLALVPAEPARDARAAAIALASTGRRYRNGAVELFDATRLDPDRIETVMSAISAAAAGGAQVIVVVDSPLRNPASIAIVRAIGLALLVVPLGEARASNARKTLESIGRERFMGSVTIPRRTR